MSSSPGGYGHYGYAQQGGYPSQRGAAGYGSSPRGQRSPSRLLWTVVAALGVVVYAVSFGADFAEFGPVWAVRGSVLAATVAALALLPKLNGHSWIAAAVAVPSFLDGLAGWIQADSAGWPVVTVAVLVGLQAAAAVAALLLDGGSTAAATRAYDGNYADYARAYQAYTAQQYQQYQQYQQSAQGAAHNAAAAPAYGVSQAASRPTAQEESYESLQARYQEYGAAPGAPAASAAAPQGGAAEQGIAYGAHGTTAPQYGSQPADGHSGQTSAS